MEFEIPMKSFCMSSPSQYALIIKNQLEISINYYLDLTRFYFSYYLLSTISLLQLIIWCFHQNIRIRLKSYRILSLLSPNLTNLGSSLRLVCSKTKTRTLTCCLGPQLFAFNFHSCMTLWFPSMAFPKNIRISDADRAYGIKTSMSLLFK